MSNDILTTIESLRRRGHYYVDEDCWYSCPEHPDYCGYDTECNCGLDEHNAKVDAIRDAVTAMSAELSVLRLRSRAAALDAVLRDLTTSPQGV